MRGVNKLIVEIKDTESEYFDRAILFLKPDKLTAEQSELNESASKLLAQVKNGVAKRRRRWILPLAAVGGAAAVTAAVICSLQFTVR